MSQPLLMPAHVARQRAAEKAAAAAAAAADSIAKRTSLNHMDSDDFVTPRVVTEQLEQLRGFITQRRLEQPGYVLPKPLGWKLQLLMLTIPEESDGGVILVDDSREARSLASPQGVVLAVAPLCYTDPSRFAAGDEAPAPWCQVGDRISIAKYDATMYMLGNGQRLGVVNDTQPVMLIDSGWEVPA